MIDSTPDTKQHILEVQAELFQFAHDLHLRAINHDKSKLESPEKEGWDNAAVLKTIEYNSPEYHQSLRDLAPTLEHHYAHNSHHPQHYPNGINDMSLLDIVEMYHDWKAAIKRAKNGNFLKSLDINRKRFEISDQLYAIFMNTYHDETHKS